MEKPFDMISFSHLVFSLRGDLVEDIKVSYVAVNFSSGQYVTVTPVTTCMLRLCGALTNLGYSEYFRFSSPYLGPCRPHSVPVPDGDAVPEWD